MKREAKRSDASPDFCLISVRIIWALHRLRSNHLGPRSTSFVDIERHTEVVPSSSGSMKQFFLKFTILALAFHDMHDKLGAIDRSRYLSENEITGVFLVGTDLLITQLVYLLLAGSHCEPANSPMILVFNTNRPVFHFLNIQD
ncbi:hypothetical protein CsSME_00013131 [Camellia sinensis var. sinensis]